ncbi:helicase-related protein [Desulfofundulus thermocisternus]|jgi:superfamily II DNA or RNA helicase|uniref:helicase-related protein n=1 Tax=Desulfofundulus thermocisternus TaxID=42471 RepID=UPI000484BD68|nr:helicase-related protein [Desulfofundulus thermocisternus]
MNLEIGDIVCGPIFPEPVKVVAVRFIGPMIKLEAVGVNSKKYYDSILSPDELAAITKSSEHRLEFTGDAEDVFLFLEGNRIRNAFQFDPLYGVSVSQVDPLPHQIEAVYHYILKNPNIRFLLADDPGAGKTIMAGLLLKELKYRGLVNRVLIIVPGHLKEQWLREMKERFQENFIIVDRGVMNASWGQNVWTERHQIITSLDFAKQDDVMFALRDSSWDLVIVDEAHKMSAYKYGEKISKTARYQFGELISQVTKYLLFLTATPHRGDPENFRLFLDLLQPGFFASTEMLAASIQNKDNPLFLRRLKEDLKGFDNTPLFPPRKVETVKYRLSDAEKMLYNAVTDYVEQNFNKALQKEKRNVAFALTILQRRLASSVRAVRKSLERRYLRLEELYKKGQILQEYGYTEDYLEDLEENQRWQKEEELLEKLTSAETLEELKLEIDKLTELVHLAREVEKQEIETKLNRLREVIEDERIKETGAKILIFTESRDTLEYLAEKINKKWGYTVTTIHGGMGMDARIRAEHEFKNRAQVMVATEAAGEGINLQFCWLMVNYDIPWNPNRLEQRMGRIHRYGQRHEVHIYNLVAVDTLEGKILEKLFEKLNRMKEELGSDRVFDVIGDVLPGTSLKDLILDAIARRRTMDDILAEMERVPDVEAIRRVREATMEALATRHIDLSRIVGEQRVARENRLVPEYIESFFLRAARKLEIKIEKRQDGLWRVTSVPFEVRNQPYEFKVKYGEVQREYLKVAFEKEKAFNLQADFVTMGHPLMEAVLETIFKRYRQEASRGAIFTDPDGKKDGLLWFMTGEIKDGRGDVAGRKLFCIYQDAGGRLCAVNPSLLWDLKPGKNSSPGTETPVLTVSREEVMAFALEQQVLPYREELLEQRRKDAALKEKYGLKSIETLILESEGKLADYETRKIKGENIPEVTIIQEQRKREDLERKKERLLEDIRVQTSLYPSEPELLAVVRVVPGNTLPDEMTADAAIEQVGMDLAMQYEREQGRQPEDVSAQAMGYDIRSVDREGNYRYIEVKARAKTGAIALTPNEWVMANRLGAEYWLYVVEQAAGEPQLYLIQNPAACLRPEEQVEIVRYVVKNWRPAAKKA